MKRVEVEAQSILNSQSLHNIQQCNAVEKQKTKFSHKNAQNRDEAILGIGAGVHTKKQPNIIVQKSF